MGGSGGGSGGSSGGGGKGGCEGGREGGSGGGDEGDSKGDSYAGSQLYIHPISSQPIQPIPSPITPNLSPHLPSPSPERRECEHARVLPGQRLSRIPRRQSEGLQSAVLLKANAAGDVGGEVDLGGRGGGCCYGGVDISLQTRAVPHCHLQQKKQHAVMII